MLIYSKMYEIIESANGKRSVLQIVDDTLQLVELATNLTARRKFPGKIVRFNFCDEEGLVVSATVRKQWWIFSWDKTYYWDTTSFLKIYLL